MKKKKSRKPARPSVQTRCTHCGRKITVRPSRIEKSKSGMVFCSHTCSAQHQLSLLPHNAQCLYCGKTFHRSPSGLERGHNTYCSRECYDKARRAGIAAKRGPGEKHGEYVECAYCGATIYRPPSQLRADGNYFCSHECMGHYWSKGAQVPRKRLLRERGRCEICGLANPAILVIHHKDRNRRNNADENLMVLCPNCQARIHRKGRG